MHQANFNVWKSMHIEMHFEVLLDSSDASVHACA